MILRIIDLCLFGLLIGWAIGIMYMASHYKQPPWYIRSIALSYITFIGGWGYELYLRLDEPLSWRAYTALGASILGLCAMIGMSFYYKPSTRKQRHEKISEDTAKEILEKHGRYH